MGGFFGWLGSCILLLIAIYGLIECCNRFSKREVHVFYHTDEEEETSSLSQIDREQKVCKSNIRNGVTL